MSTFFSCENFHKIHSCDFIKGIFCHNIPYFLFETPKKVGPS
jgi:hypothetical protein